MNLSGWISQLSLIWHPKGMCGFLFEDSQAHSTFRSRPLSRSKWSSLPQGAFCSVQSMDTGLHAWKTLRMKYGWSKNVSSVSSWSHHWGHSKGQNVCFLSPFPYLICLGKLGEKFWNAGNLREQKVTERWIYLCVRVDWILPTLQQAELSQWQIETLLWLQRTNCESEVEMSVETEEQQTALFSYSCGFAWWWWHMPMKMCSMNSSCYLSEHLCQHWRICVGVTCKRREREKERPWFGKKSQLIKDQQWQVGLFISWASDLTSFPLLISKSEFSFWTKQMTVWWLRKGVGQGGLE